MAGLKRATLYLYLLISQALAINVILFAKAPTMAKEVTKDWIIPEHTCDNPEQKIVEKMGSWSSNKYQAQMGKGQNARVIVKPNKDPESEAAAQKMLGDMESILIKNTKKGWCEKLIDKLKGGAKSPQKNKGKGKGKRKRMVGSRRGTRARRTYRTHQLRSMGN